MMRKTIIAGLLAPVILAAFVLPTSAENPFTAMPKKLPVCKGRTELIDGLRNKLLRSTSFGLQANGQVLEIFRDAHGSWAAVLHGAGGNSCLVAYGEAWTELRELPGDDA